MSVSVGGGYVWGRQVVDEMDPRMASQGQRTECQLCCTTVPTKTFVQFLPCAHEACSSCMHDLRKSAIHKARPPKSKRRLAFCPTPARSVTIAFNLP